MAAGAMDRLSSVEELIETHEGCVMRERQSFGVFVRSFGLVLLVYGVYGTVHTLIGLFGMATRYPEPVATGFLLSVIWFAMGIVLMRATDLVVRFTYPTITNSN
jgi:hypothetical protein